MAESKYKCSSCEHSFVGDEVTTTECEKCKSNQLRVIESGFKISGNFKFLELIKRYKIPILVLLGFILLIKFISRDNSNSDIDYQVEVIKQVDNYLELLVIKGEIDGDGKFYRKEGKKEYFKGDLNDIIHSVTLIGLGNKKIQDNNRIYLCKENEGPLSLKFEFNNSKQKPQTKSASFKLVGEESNKASCKIQQLSPTDISVAQIANCKLKVTVLRSLNGIPFFVSVTGKDGPYESKEIWDRKGLTKMDLYVYIQGQDTSMATGCAQNGDKITQAGCISCDPNSLKSQFISIANTYLSDPSNRDLQRPFQNFIINKFTEVQIRLNGQIITDLSSFQNIIRVNYLNNGRKYKIDGIPEVTANCGVSFKVIEY